MESNYTKIYTEKIILHKDIEDRDIVLVTTYNKILIFDRNDLSNDLTSYQVIFNGQVPRTSICDSFLRISPHSLDVIVYPYLLDYTYEQMLQEPLQLVITRNVFLERNVQVNNKSSLIVKLEKDTFNEYYISYYINNKIIENVKAGKKESKTNMLTNILLNNTKREMLQRMNCKLFSLKRELIDNHQLNSLSFDINFSELLKTNITLYNYQQEDVKWMLNIKQNVESGNNNLTFKFNKVLPVMQEKEQDPNFLFYNGTLVPYTGELIQTEMTNMITYKGGNIISEVGLGKTMISLCYIFIGAQKNRPIYNNYVVNSSKCSYLYKRGKNKGNMCDNECVENTLHCKLHKNTLFIDKPHLTFRNLEQFDISKFICHGLIRTNASLIVAPNHLCDQWVKEYYHKFKNDKRVVIVITLDQYKGLQLSDILFADIVVVSYQLLMNIYHKRKVGNGESDFQKLQKMDVLKILQSKLWSDFKSFYWDNIILDEVHEVNGSGYKFTSILDQIHSSCVWNVTGTPFPNGISSFLDLMYNTTSYKTRSLDLNTIANTGMNEDLVDTCMRLFRRNTKQSVLSELKKNVIKEEVLKLDFTLQERSLYDSYKQNVREKLHDFLIKICCHPELYSDTREMVKNCKTLDEIQEVMLKHNKNKIDALKLTITNLEHNMKTYESMLIGQHDEQVIESINVKIISTKKRITNDKKTLSDITRTYQYLKNAIEELKNKNELTCPVCLDEIPEKDMTVTMCGHKFCWDCVYQNYKINSHSKQFKCPFCNTFMDTKDVYIISQQANLRKSAGELNSIINDVKSTKIGNIIYFLKNKKHLNPDDKIILFSQWDELLHKVGSKLQEYDLKISYCNGTVYQKKRAIDDFKNNDTNIIMLSSRNAASGINLTNANTIIFLEPVYGTSDYRKDIEYQAIGRADRIGQMNEIKVFRFIIRNTIEEDILENNISVRQIS